jgi:syntaxin 16
MAKLKKSEAFTVEREKEIQQVRKSCICTVIHDTFNSMLSSQLIHSFWCLLLQVVESVNELAQIMKDLSVLVIDQVSRSSPSARR